MNRFGQLGGTGIHADSLFPAARPSFSIGVTSSQTRQFFHGLPFNKCLEPKVPSSSPTALSTPPITLSTRRLACRTT